MEEQSASTKSQKSWCGTSMSDMYRGHGPWGFESQTASPSRHHSVLYQLPVTLKSPPKPHISSQVHHWDDDHVRMPYSSKNLFPVKDENGSETVQSRWELIQLSLLQPITSSNQLEQVICSYNSKIPRLLALHYFFEEVLEREEEQHFFEHVLPGIVSLALQLPEILPGNLPLLKQGINKSVSLSQLQIASLLANAFLCTFPWRKDSAATYPGVNFIRLYAAYQREKRKSSVAEKLKCICHYFRRVISKAPVGIVTFERKYLTKYQLPRWDRLEENLGNTKIHVSSTGIIEADGDGLLQVDFANKCVGGGVLGYGCVQEEIRYVICPELIVSRLFTEQLESTEALVVTGAERFSSYEGYGDTFTWSGDFVDDTPYDNSGRKQTSIVAIDATRFNKSSDQYRCSLILRELNKAYSGFHSKFEGLLPPVATGNWGCGAFRGDPHLKSLIQLMACSAARRDMIYFTFGDEQLRDKIYEMYTFLATNRVTIVQLWRYFCRFCDAKLKPEHLYSYIQQAHLDSKQQQSIRNFLPSIQKKNDTHLPSTSKCNNGNRQAVQTKHTEDNAKTEHVKNDNIIKKISSNVDIIESSQPDDCVLSYIFKQKSGCDVKASTNTARKRDFDDGTHEKVLHLINVIDDVEDTPKNRRQISNASLLSSIDDISTRTKNDNIVQKDATQKASNNDVKNCDTVVDMEVEDVEISNTNFPMTEEGITTSFSKRKITDYFCKVDKG